MRIQFLPDGSLFVFRYFIYLPHNYNNYLKMPKEKKNVLIITNKVVINK